MSYFRCPISRPVIYLWWFHSSWYLLLGGEGLKDGSGRPSKAIPGFGGRLRRDLPYTQLENNSFQKQFV